MTDHEEEIGSVDIPITYGDLIGESRPVVYDERHGVYSFHIVPAWQGWSSHAMYVSDCVDKLCDGQKFFEIGISPEEDSGADYFVYLTVDQLRVLHGILGKVLRKHDQ